MNKTSCPIPKTILLRKISEYSFALVDLGLYLDTHPKDQNAIKNYMQLSDTYKQYVNEYADNYGPLCSHPVNCENYYSWVAEPWPWEGEC